MRWNFAPIVYLITARLNKKSDTTIIIPLDHLAVGITNGVLIPTTTVVDTPFPVPERLVSPLFSFPS